MEINAVTFLAEQLKNSIFTLLHPEMEQFARRLHEALLYGSIPILLGDAQEREFLKTFLINIPLFSCLTISRPNSMETRYFHFSTALHLKNSGDFARSSKFVFSWAL